jgi:hypothetical protein
VGTKTKDVMTVSKSRSTAQPIDSMRHVMNHHGLFQHQNPLFQDTFLVIFGIFKEGKGAQDKKKSRFFL